MMVKEYIFMYVQPIKSGHRQPRLSKRGQAEIVSTAATLITNTVIKGRQWGTTRVGLPLNYHSCLSELRKSSKGRRFSVTQGYYRLPTEAQEDPHEDPQSTIPTSCSHIHTCSCIRLCTQAKECCEQYLRWSVAASMGQSSSTDHKIDIFDADWCASTHVLLTLTK